MTRSWCRLYHSNGLWIRWIVSVPKQNQCCQLSVWKFRNFTDTQILREINFWDSRSSKKEHSNIFDFWGSEIRFWWFLYNFWGVNLATETAEKAVFEPLNFLKLISRKISTNEQLKLNWFFFHLVFTSNQFGHIYRLKKCHFWQF